MATRNSSKEIEIQTDEYMPVGPARLARYLPKKPAPALPPPVSAQAVQAPPSPPARQFPFGIEVADRKPGHIYDADSGGLMGSASERVKAERQVGVPWTDDSGGYKKRLVLA